VCLFQLHVERSCLSSVKCLLLQSGVSEATHNWTPIVQCLSRVGGKLGTWTKQAFFSVFTWRHLLQFLILDRLVQPVGTIRKHANCGPTQRTGWCSYRLLPWELVAVTGPEFHFSVAPRALKANMLQQQKADDETGTDVGHRDRSHSPSMTTIKPPGCWCASRLILLPLSSCYKQFDLSYRSSFNIGCVPLSHKFT